ncbi:hypothetical protein 1 [Hubei sobemo-like virus 13]|uniref:hypothetical protein 1 n=1 Tax=Hubei sobemo-like virus 13 TaxID=1923198 RepID=UPI00090B9D0A|nr:hypothetical protein 1 [Hubei sobemo-like virus 13]APG75953.1 hypothetical protein 1 [Hubei sobemo-like virus 13]
MIKESLFFTGGSLITAIFILAVQETPKIPDCVCSLSMFDTTEVMWEIWQRHSDIIYIIGPIVGLAVIFALWCFMRWFFRGTKTIVKIIWHNCVAIGHASGSPLYIPERYVEGSEYAPKIEPKFQVGIWVNRKKDKNWTFIGNGWRLGKTLITVTHNTTEDDTLRIRSATGFLDLESERFRDLGCDLSAADIADGEWSKLQVTSARIPKLALTHPQVVYVGSSGMASSGMLKPYFANPHLVYEGSTKPGFSGAPLYTGNIVYGMHVGAGSSNMALDSNWIAAIAFRNESSEEFILQELFARHKRTGKNIKFHGTAPGESWIMYNGKYRVFDDEDIPEYIRNVLEYASPSTEYNDEREQDDAFHDRPGGSGYRPRFTFDDTASQRIDIQVEEPTRVEPVQQVYIPEAPYQTEQNHLNLRTASAIAEARQLRQGAPVPPPRSVAGPVSLSLQRQTVRTGGQQSIPAVPSVVSHGICESQQGRELISRGARRKRSKKQKPALSQDLVV